MQFSEQGTSTLPCPQHASKQARNKHAAVLTACKLASKKQARCRAHSMQVSEQGTSTLPYPQHA
eukprot:242151-Chlamydomonas_euryale.AAC.1